MSTLSNTNVEKHLPQGDILTRLFWSICLQKWKNHHRTSIISVFTRSNDPALTKAIGASDVAKNGVSEDSSISR